MCECECGNISEVAENHLQSGHTKSCGKCNYINVKPGDKYGKLTVIEDMGYFTKPNTKRREHYIKCECECGNTAIILRANLISGKSKSCGCETALNEKDPRSDVPEIFRHYKVAAALLKRCRDPKNPRFPHYGGRGILCNLGKTAFDVAESLSKIENYRDGMSIDRIDNNGNYEIGNIEWLDFKLNSGKTLTSLNLTKEELSQRLIPRSRIERYIKKTRNPPIDFDVIEFESDDVSYIDDWVLIVHQSLDKESCVKMIQGFYERWGAKIKVK